MAFGLVIGIAGCGSGIGPTDLGAGDGPSPRRTSASSAPPAVKVQSPTRDLLRSER
jgi:hypothetical protein